MPDLSQDGGRTPQGDGSGRVRIDDSDASNSHGRAALLLVESLIHSLVEKAVLTRAEAIEVIDVAIDVEEEVALVEHLPELPKRESPLAPLAASFRL